MENLSEEELRQVKSNIRVLFSLMYNFEDRLKDEMQERIDYLEKFIDNLLDLYNKIKAENKNYKYAIIPRLEGEIKGLKDGNKYKIREKIKEKQAKINKLHPASDYVIIDDLENQIEVLEELLEE